LIKFSGKSFLRTPLFNPRAHLLGLFLSIDFSPRFWISFGYRNHGGRMASCGNWHAFYHFGTFKFCQFLYRLLIVIGVFFRKIKMSSIRWLITCAFVKMALNFCPNPRRIHARPCSSARSFEQLAPVFPG
jgi:hypothetical protein